MGTGRKDEGRVGIMREKNDPAFKKSGKRKKMKERKNKAGKTDADFNKKGKRKKGRKDRRGNNVAFTAENKQKKEKVIRKETDPEFKKSKTRQEGRKGREDRRK